MTIEIEDGGIVIDATLIGPLLNVAPEDVPKLMRDGAITSLCETGVGDDAGAYRLSFFYQGRRVRLQVSEAGEVLRRSSVDYGDIPLPQAMHRPGG
ncbi:DUF6522 family protein [Hoeflea sp. AS16]|uniref:DUF6522 family protein n=1 Tax=unclassified Hoeflea TaxID=2614931 RepID=UPI00317F831A